jgi:hypothetical protein
MISILDVLRYRTPRALLEGNEVSVCVWNSTPLIGGSVRQTSTYTSSTANALRGVLYRKARPYGVVKEAS